MYQTYRNGYLYDVFDIRKAIEAFIDTDDDTDIILQYFLERTLFRDVGLNVVWEIKDDPDLYRAKVLMESTLHRNVVTDTFSLSAIPAHLRSAECHLVIECDSVIILYP